MGKNKIQMKYKVFVAGSSGFIGGHLVRRLKQEGFFVIGADIEDPKYESPHVFYKYDLRNESLTRKIFSDHKIVDVYNLACLMGGMGYIGDPKHNYDVMVGSSQIVANVLSCAVEFGSDKIFYSSSACVYNESLQMSADNPGLKESDAYPAMPDLVYGWQKIFSEQMHEAAKDRIKIRVARFHNIFGPEGTWNGGKEKAPAAMCRKVAEARFKFSMSLDSNPPIECDVFDPVEVWGTGEQTRSFLYIDDCIDAVRLLMESEHTDPINIGSEEIISINNLAQMAIDISGKRLTIQNIPGNVGVKGRNSDNTIIESVLGWKPKFSLYDGMVKTYSWIKSQVEK